MMKKSIAAFDSADFELVKSIALTFPGTEESVSHEGTPSVKANGKLMCRLHETGAFIPIRLDFTFREVFLERYPEFFLLPDHYKAYPYVCIWTGTRDKTLLKEVLTLSWKGLATKRQLIAFDNQAPGK